MRTTCDWKKEIISLLLIEGRGQGVVEKVNYRTRASLLLCLISGCHEISFYPEVASGILNFHFCLKILEKGFGVWSPTIQETKTSMRLWISPSACGKNQDAFFPKKREEYYVFITPEDLSLFLIIWSSVMCSRLNSFNEWWDMKVWGTGDGIISRKSVFCAPA